MAIRPQDHEVLDVVVVELDPAVHRVLERRVSLRHLEADCPRGPCSFEPGDLLRRQAQARTVVLPRLAARLCLLALRLQPLGRAVAVIGVTVRDEPLRHHLVSFEPLRLEVGRVRTTRVRAFIPIEAKPPEAIEDPFHHLVR